MEVADGHRAVEVLVVWPELPRRAVKLLGRNGLHQRAEQALGPTCITQDCILRSSTNFSETSPKLTSERADRTPAGRGTVTSYATDAGTAQGA